MDKKGPVECYRRRHKSTEAHGVDKLQLRESIVRLAEEIKSKTKHVNQLISVLFADFVIHQADLEKVQVCTSDEDKLSFLIEIILSDTTGGKAKKFLDALFSSNNKVVYNVIVGEARNTSKEWLEVEKLVRDCIQQNYKLLTENLRDVNSLVARLISDDVIISCRGESNQDKIKHILQQLHGSDISSVMCFFKHSDNNPNAELFRIIGQSKLMVSLHVKLEEVFEDMLSNMKEILLTKLKDIIPIPGELFHLDVIEDRAKLLRLNAILHVPKGRYEGMASNCRWQNGQDTYKIKDADRLFVDNVKEHRVILVEGNPGSGKTVFLQRWTMGWATDSLPNKNSFIIYIPARSVHSHDLIDIIFEDLILIGKQYRPAFEYFMQDVAFQRRLTFLIDGLDERISSFGHSDIWKLINRTKLPEATVIVTTRMYQSVLEKLKPYADLMVTLNGVTEESRGTFIHRMLGEKAGPEDVETFISRCKDFLFDHKILGVPIYLTLLCVLAREHCASNSLQTLSIPRTRLEMYDTFAEVFEKRYSAKMPVVSHVREHIKKSLPLLKHLIGRMSFYKLAQEDHVFYQSDLEDNFLEADLVQKIGYFIEVPGSLKQMNGGQRAYTFCHKTFQEYFAGIFCAKIGFPKTAMHLMTLKRTMFNNKRILDGLENVCIRKEWEPPKQEEFSEETKTMEESFRQLVTTIQFASGMSAEFGKDVFLYGICACHLQANQDKNNRSIFDTQYETSLVFESQDVSLVKHYARYLLNVKKNRMYSDFPSVPDNYSMAMYDYVCKNMPNHFKCLLLTELYGIKASVCWNDNCESIITESRESKTGDILESYLLENQLPSVISVAGADVDLQLLTSAISNSDEVTHLEIRNKDMSTLGYNIWRDLIDVLQSRPLLKELRFPFCNLQNCHLEDIFLNLARNPSTQLIDISGNNLSSLTESLQKVIAHLIKRQCTNVSICHNFVIDHDWCSSMGTTNVIYKKVYIESFARFYNPMLKALCIDQSFLRDIVSQEKWTIATEKLGNCSDLEKLKLTACKMNENFHLQGLGQKFNLLPKLVLLDLSQNNFCHVDSATWESFVHSITKLTALRYLHLSKCHLVHDYQIQILGRTLAEFPDLTTLNLSANSYGNLCETEVVKFLRAFKTLAHLKVLDLSKCELHKRSCLLAVGDALHKMKCIATINLSGNSFEEMDSPSMAKFTEKCENAKSLRELSFSRCRLTKSLHITGITKLVTQCCELQTIDLSHNNLSNIDEISWSFFCASLPGNKYLLTINFTNCHLIHQVRSLAKSVDKIKNLKEVLLAKNNMQNVTPSDWQGFINALGKATVEKLYLGKCGLQPGHFKGNATCMGKLQHLTALDMTHNALGRIATHDWHVFISGLKHCQKLQYLKLSKNSLTGEHVASLGETLGFLHQTLLHFNLDGNNLGDSDHTEWDIFTKQLAKCSRLKKLAISKCKIHQDFQVERLAKTLGHLVQLEHLDVSENDFHDINEVTWEHFTESLKHCFVLDKLNVNECKLHHTYHFKKLGNALPCFPQLRRINVVGNDLSNAENWQFVVLALNNCKQLQYIKASNSGLNSDMHVDIMIPVLRSLPRLTEITMSKNKLSKQAFRKLMEAFLRCTQLRKVDLRECHDQLGKTHSKWHAGDDGMTIKLFAKSVIQKLDRLG